MIAVTTDIKRALRDLNALVEDKIPRAVVSAINSSAYHARQALYGTYPSTFTQRVSWVRRQIQYRPAKLDQWPRPTARVGSTFKGMYYQEHGGTKEGRKYPFIGVPMPNAPRMRTKRGRTPELLLKKPGFAVIEHKGKSFLIYKRVRRGKDGGPAKRRKRRKVRRPSPEVEFIYLLSKQIHEKPRWNLDQAVVDSVKRHFGLRLAERMNR